VEDFKVGGQRLITFDRFIRGVIFLALLGLALGLIYYLRSVLIPFFVAWVVAYLLYPVVRFFQTRLRVRNRLVAIIFTLLLTVGVLTAFLYLVIPPMNSELTHLKDVALRYLQQGVDGSNLPAPVLEFFRTHVNEYQVEKFLQQDDVMVALKDAVPKAWSVLWSTAGILINIVVSLIALLYLLFILTDYERYANGWINFVPRSKRTFAAQLVSDIENGMAGYFRGQALVALSNCVMFSVGFWLIGFPVPIGLGCLIGVISFVPYLQVVGFLPATLLALLKASETGENFWWLMLLVLIVYVVVQVLQDTIFTPRIMGKIMGLPPAIILLSLSVWGYALGIVGLIIALPVTTLAISYYKRYVVGEGVPLSSAQNAEDEALERSAGIYVDAQQPASPSSGATTSEENASETTEEEK